MKTLFNTAFAVLLAGFATSAIAQTTTETEAETDTETTAEAAETEAPADGELAVGATYSDAEFGDWELRCIKAAEGPDPCQLYQLLTDGNDNPVAEISLLNVKNGGEVAAAATIITPLETLLVRQVSISVDGGAVKKYPFTFCNTVGCFARIGLTNDDLASYRAGNAAKIQVVPAAAPDQTVDVSVSLTGFTAGFNTLSERNAQ
jgi:invasion protein IalB